MNRIIEFFLPEGEFSVPDAIIDVFHNVLDPIAPNWWAEWETVELNDYYHDRGDIIARVWLDKHDYDKHYQSDFVIYVGYWADAPSKMKGRWHYYYSAQETEKDLKRKLKEVETA